MHRHQHKRETVSNDRRAAFASAGTIITDSDIRSAAIIDSDLGHSIDDPHLDAICRFVASQCDTPIALVSLVDEAEQRFLGRAGTELRSTPRSTSFCATAMLDRSVMVVPDARLDPRFANYSLVIQSPHLNFYAGAPLITKEGVPLGALCVLDTEARDAGLSEAQHDMLLLMAAAVMDRLSLRRAVREAAAALDESEMRFHLLTDSMPQMAWSCRPTGYTDYFNARWYDFTGLTEAESNGDAWMHNLHPDDVIPTTEAWCHSVDTGEPYDIEYRLRRADGEYRWTLARGLPMRDPGGQVIRWFGTCTDIHDHRLALEEREIVSQELSHRIKNIFAVISGLIGLSAREAPSYRPVADMLRDRILALGRAHDFVRPHSRDSHPASMQENSLHGLLGELFAPYEAKSGDRITISGEDVPIDDRSATPLALLFHEIVTNAAKYGALSEPKGRVALSIHINIPNIVTMVWWEQGGPVVDGASINPSGFGSRLLDLSVRRQLGGDFEQEWRAEGLVMRVTVPVSAFSRHQPD
jgi:PAS domain S-box-containing protein